MARPAARTYPAPREGDAVENRRYGERSVRLPLILPVENTADVDRETHIASLRGEVLALKPLVAENRIDGMKVRFEELLGRCADVPDLVRGVEGRLASLSGEVDRLTVRELEEDRRELVGVFEAGHAVALRECLDRVAPGMFEEEHRRDDVWHAAVDKARAAGCMEGQNGIMDVTEQARDEQPLALVVKDALRGVRRMAKHLPDDTELN
ncbi:hypothetical protein ANO11243_078680 [Dothideomycetidae sp. 11243]|nr:hypothetical protein ANO11243_078680 [fungal sp. No.11243]